MECVFLSVPIFYIYFFYKKNYASGTPWTRSPHLFASSLVALGRTYSWLMSERGLTCVHVGMWRAKVNVKDTKILNCVS